ncbi:universal stress protein [Jongsikchunia kroppenstedtii]|uniref:universal stress protein n=1 Tax=Jongsikchunia kroppenstedtii TaxID=1121721 RepID=UPI00039D7638|nr:universal stress protein [Jongsikchunia kroppenstedtii]
MNTSAPITVGVDGSAESDAAVRWATAEAIRRRSGLLLVSVFNPSPMSAGYMAIPIDLTTPMRDAAQDNLRLATDIAEQIAKDERAALHIERRIICGNVRQSLIAVSRQASTLVLGVRGSDHAQFGLIGSTAWALAGHAKCSVTIVHDQPGRQAPDRPVVVVGVDGSPSSASAVDVAFTEAGLMGAKLVAVHAWDYRIPGPVLDPFHGLSLPDVEQAATTLLSDQLAAYREQHPEVEVEQVLAHDQPIPAITAAALDADLLVVGSRGRGGFTSLLLGSTSHGLLSTVECPLMIVR